LQISLEAHFTESRTIGDRKQFLPGSSRNLKRGSKGFSRGAVALICKPLTRPGRITSLTLHKCQIMNRIGWIWGALGHSHQVENNCENHLSVQLYFFRLLPSRSRIQSWYIPLVHIHTLSRNRQLFIVVDVATLKPRHEPRHPSKTLD
jgi:hypothetical protein